MIPIWSSELEDVIEVACQLSIILPGLTANFSTVGYPPSTSIR